MARKSAGRDPLADVIGDKAARRLRARTHPGRPVWFGLGMFGMVGWAVVVPMGLGVALGVWIDRHWPGRVSWTLTLLFLGTVLGCLNAWRWISREGRGNHPGA